MTANVTPDWMDPSILTWTNGTPDSSNLQRLVTRSTTGDTSVQAAIGTSQAGTVSVHVVDATEAPAATNNAPKTWSLGRTITPPNDAGLTVFGGDYGITDPTYQFTPHISGNRWVFRLGEISHRYAQGINSAWGGGPVRQNLPIGDVLPFPLGAGIATTQQAYDTARSDLDTSGLVAVGPDRTRYWVQAITQNHENEHVNRFYSPQFWQQEMNAFESFLETNAATTKNFSCFSPYWADATTAKSTIQSVLDYEMESRHGKAADREGPESELRTHGITNPQYVPIHSAIPSAFAPQINVGGIVPSTIRRGDSNKYLEIYGLYLNASPSVSASGTGVTVMIEYVGKYQVNIKYSVSTDAPLGQRTLTLTTAYGTSNQPITVSN